jgi:PAS domain S-box-containing protein
MTPRDLARSLSSTLVMLQVAVGLSYFVLAKGGLMLALVHPSASPVWPATGFAIASVLLWGPQLAPAIFVGAFLANLGDGAFGTALAIASGNTLEAIVAAYLANRWSEGTRTFETPTNVAIFALIAAFAATPISATVGVIALWTAGAVATETLGAMWLTWWLGDLAGAIVVAPVMVLWFRNPPTAKEMLALLPVLVVAALLGLAAFGSPVASSSGFGLFSFLAVGPLLWAALYRDRRVTAAVALILAIVAIASTVFAPEPGLNNAFLMTLIFIISTTVPSLALSADVAMRRDAEERLRLTHEALETGVERRAAELVKTHAELMSTVERKNQLEAANTHQHIQLVEAQRLANLGSWSWDVRSGMVRWSPQLYEIYGLTPETFGNSVDDFLSCVHPDDRAAVSQNIAAAMRTGEGFHSQERIVRPDGAIRYLESCGEVVKDRDGNVVELLGVCRDVTPERIATRALRESEEQLRRLINGIHDYAIFMLDPGGHIVSWNAGAARIMGYTREEVLGKHVSLFHTPEDKAANLPRHVIETAAQEGRYEGEGWRVRRDGTRLWANVVVDAIYDTEGRLMGFGKITRDVTEKREARLALETAQIQLAQAQKMEAIGQVTGGVAHDFNNLLAALISSLELLEKRLPDDTQTRRLFGNALDAAERGASLTQRLLTFARRQNLKPEIVEIPDLVSGMADLLGRAIGPTITVETAASGQWTTARVDPTQLELAIFNLALNARDAMPDGGTLSIDIADDRVTNPVPNDELKPGRYVRITVKDTGTGMDEKTLQRATEPFFTTKGTGKGTGLGLSMVQGLAVQSGGALSITSKPGAGTSITMWLPASEQVAAPVVARHHHEPVNGGQRCHVLVVDDDPLVSLGTVAMLEDLGHSVVEVSSGGQALKALEAEENIDVVITDQAMPGMTGTELVRKIRESRPEMPIILATGWAELPDNTVPEFLRLSKPYRQEDLAVALSKVLKKTGVPETQPPDRV